MPKIKQNVKQVKGRYWVCVAYPDSLPSDWEEIIRATGLPSVVSPLHDADFNADESQKKAHYHIIFCFSGPTTYANVNRITDKLNATIPMVCHNIKSYYRYLTHEDNPEKAQYNKNDIKCFNGFVPSDYFDLTNSEGLKLWRELKNYIISNKISNIADLFEQLELDGLDDLEIYASKHTILTGKFVDGMWQRMCYGAGRVPGAPRCSPVSYDFNK